MLAPFPPYFPSPSILSCSCSQSIVLDDFFTQNIEKLRHALKHRSSQKWRVSIVVEKFVNARRYFAVLNIRPIRIGKSLDPEVKHLRV